MSQSIWSSELDWTHLNLAFWVEKAVELEPLLSFAEPGVVLAPLAGRAELLAAWLSPVVKVGTAGNTCQQNCRYEIGVLTVNMPHRDRWGRLFIPYVVPETHECGPVCVAGMILTTPVALILIGVELQCSHVGKELRIEKPFPQRDSPAVTASWEASVARLLVDARGEQEARIGENLVKRRKIANVNVRESFGTSAAGLCHVKSVQPSVFSHTAWQSCTIGSQSHLGNRCNPIKPAKPSGIAPDLMVSTL